MDKGRGKKSPKRDFSSFPHVLTYACGPGQTKVLWGLKGVAKFEVLLRSYAVLETLPVRPITIPDIYSKYEKYESTDMPNRFAHY